MILPIVPMERGFFPGRELMLASRQNNLVLLVAFWVILACPALAQTPQARHYSLVFHNPWAEVLDLDLPADRVAPIHENQNDLLWIALDDQAIEVQAADGQRQDLFLRTGDVRLMPRRALKSVFNSTGRTIRAAIVQIQGLRVPDGTCDCMGAAKRSVCGCARSHLPAFWAEVVGELTLAGTTLDPEQSVDESEDRDDTLLIAVTSAVLVHEVEAFGAPAQLELHPGEATWLPAGKHHLRNVSKRATQVVTVEFGQRAHPITR